MAHRQRKNEAARLAAIRETLMAVFEEDGGPDILLERGSLERIASSLQVPYEALAAPLRRELL